MKTFLKLRGLAAAALIVFVATPAIAQDKASQMTANEVRTEISQAMNAIANYSEQERDEALAEAREAINQIDGEIERREQALREEWSEMSDAAREAARSNMQDLRAARNKLGERYGALQVGTSDAWDELKAGFADAWKAFSEAWSTAEVNGEKAM